MSRTVDYTENGRLNSSAVDYYWYNSNTQELYVEFTGSNRIAGYAGVTQVVVNDFLRASSTGGFYSSKIKGVYSGISGDIDNFVEDCAPKASIVPTANQFVITGLVPVSESIQASTLEEAIEIFRNRHPEGKVATASVQFV